MQIVRLSKIHMLAKQGIASLLIGLCLVFTVMANDAPILVDVTIQNEEGRRYDFQLELAETPEKRKQGLMHRKTLAKNSGMLFVWPDNAVRLFWMKDTPIALDILFFDDTGALIFIHPNAKPNSQDTISSLKPAKYVVEINAGLSREMGLENAAKLLIHSPLPPAK